MFPFVEFQQTGSLDFSTTKSSRTSVTFISLLLFGYWLRRLHSFIDISTVLLNLFKIKSKIRATTCVKKILPELSGKISKKSTFWKGVGQLTSKFQELSFSCSTLCSCWISTNRLSGLFISTASRYSVTPSSPSFRRSTSETIQLHSPIVRITILQSFVKLCETKLRPTTDWIEILWRSSKGIFWESSSCEAFPPELFSNRLIGSKVISKPPFFK